MAMAADLSVCTGMAGREPQRIRLPAWGAHTPTAPLPRWIRRPKRRHRARTYETFPSAARGPPGKPHATRTWRRARTGGFCPSWRSCDPSYEGRHSVGDQYRTWASAVYSALCVVFVQFRAGAICMECVTHAVRINCYLSPRIGPGASTKTHAGFEAAVR